MYVCIYNYTTLIIVLSYIFYRYYIKVLSNMNQAMYIYDQAVQEKNCSIIYESKDIM